MKHQVLATTRDGGTIRGQREPTGLVNHTAGIYYSPPTNPNKEPF